jgi:succinate dehydrogenase flavin-adding protein (antitoxin of CptAB toxin-antitoxin module)
MMADLMHDATLAACGKTLGEAIQHDDGAHLRQWFSILESLDPDLAHEVAGIRVLTDEDAEEVFKAGGDVDALLDSSTPWDWIRNARDLPSFTSAIMTPVFGRMDWWSLEADLHKLFTKAVEEHDRDLVRLVRAMANIAREASVESVEAKLGMSLGEAYEAAGERPHLVLEFDPEEGYMLMRDEAQAKVEVEQFLRRCIDGINHESLVWQEYTRRLADTSA